MGLSAQKLEHDQVIFKIFSFFLIWSTLLSIWAAVWINFYADVIMRPFGYKGNWLVFGVYGTLILLFSRLYGGYQVGYYRKWDLAVSGLLALFFTNGVTYLQTCLIGRAIMDFNPFIGMTITQALAILIWAYLAGRLYTNIFPPYESVIIAGDAPAAQTLLLKMRQRSDRYRIQQIICAEEGDFDAISQKALEYQAVILCGLPARMRNKLLKFCFQHQIRSYTTPKLSDILIRGGLEITLFDTPLLLNRNQGLKLSQRILKRALDLSFSSIALVAALPFMALIAIAIKLHDGGPVLFFQERCSMNNKVFRICKFRSMVVDAEKDGQPNPAADEDPRITAVGRILRAFRLDELPQLFNVIKGDMSLVGPRPERIEHVAQYTEMIPEFSFRSKVKGGLTGYAQIMGRYNTEPYDKLKMDLMYISNYSLIEDIKIILMTMKALLMKESTQGFKTLSKNRDKQ